MSIVLMVLLSARTEADRATRQYVEANRVYTAFVHRADPEGGSPDGR